MTTLSLNVNKIATLRNSRGKNQPNLEEAIKKLINFGVKGITVHPRPDGRHILYEDVRQIKNQLKNLPKMVELNVEAYPSEKFMALMKEVKPSQCTLVPDAEDVLTSNAGWQIQKNFRLLEKSLKTLKEYKIRSSLFIDPFCLEKKELEFLFTLKPKRVELYTEAYAKAFPTSKRDSVIHVYIAKAQEIIKQGIELNAGHDLNLENLGFLLKKIPEIKEVSIGHALICEALYMGLETVTKKYLKICQGQGQG